MNKKIQLGQLIEEEVRKQQIPIVKFADMICCGRNNVYRIFERSDLYVDQLAKISKVLKRNFLQELADNPSLIDIENEDVIREMENRRAVSQFMEVVPNVLYRMGKQPVIAFGRPIGLEEDIDIPDFMITEYNITFTKGGFISEKYINNPIFEIKVYENGDGIKVYSMFNTRERTQMIDVKLDYKTEEEWEKTLRFIFDTFKL